MLLTTGNPKTAKGEGYGVFTAIMHLAPSNVSGRNVCLYASPECISLCLNTAGRGGIMRKGETSNMIQDARIRRTDFFFSNRAGFLSKLRAEIRRHVRRARKYGLRPAVRLNGTSDLAFERIFSALFSEFSDVVFYDYTKDARRMRQYLAGEFPANYSLTFSRSEINATETADILARGGNVAVVFDTRKGKDLPETWNGVPVIDGDTTDLRFMDPRGVVVGLRAKGRARKSQFHGGFVVVTGGTASSVALAHVA